MSGYTYKVIAPTDRAYSEGKPWLVEVRNRGKLVTYREFDTEAEAQGYVRDRAPEKGGQMVPDRLLDQPSPLGPTYRELAELLHASNTGKSSK